MLYDAIVLLADRSAFYSHFLAELKIVVSDDIPAPAGVSVTGGEIILMMHPEKFSAFPAQERAAILEHEIKHIVHNHLGNPDYDTNPQRWNYAMDVAINQTIPNLPKGVVSLEDVRKVIPEAKAEETSEYYYHLLGQLDTSEHTQIDDHGEFSNLDELGKSVLKRAVANAAKAAGASVPTELRKFLNVGEAQVNWRAVLKNFILSTPTNQYRYTVNKTNRRKPEIPGRKRKRTVNLGVCLDVSGSVSDDQVALFFSEIKSMLGQVSSIHLIQASSDVVSADRVTKKTLVPERLGSGGTYYQPAIDKCLELECNVIVYFGDMDTADTPQNPKIPVLWAIVGRNNPPVPWGKSIRIKENSI